MMVSFQRLGVGGELVVKTQLQIGKSIHIIVFLFF